MFVVAVMTFVVTTVVVDLLCSASAGGQYKFSKVPVHIRYSSVLIGVLVTLGEDGHARYGSADYVTEHCVMDEEVDWFLLLGDPNSLRQSLFDWSWSMIQESWPFSCALMYEELAGLLRQQVAARRYVCRDERQAEKWGTFG